MNNPARRGMMKVHPISNSLFSKLSLFVLKLAVYSNSSVLTITFLSLYGLVQGVARVPINRLSAVKSLLHYGVEVLQKGLGTSMHVS
jgi:hypothetical protein